MIYYGTNKTIGTTVTLRSTKKCLTVKKIKK